MFAIRKKLASLLVSSLIVGLFPFLGVGTIAEAAVTYGPNLLVNGSFEQWSGGVPSGWSRALAGGGTLQQETAPGNVADGTSSVRLSAPAADVDSASLRRGNIPIRGRTDYQVAFTYKKPQTLSTSFVYFKLTYRRADNTAITPTTVEKLPMAAVPDFVRFEKIFTAPDDAVSVTYELLMQRGAEIIVDDASYTEVIPIVLNASIDPSLVTFDKYEPNRQDLTVSIIFHGHELSGIYNGADALQNGIDYALSGSTVWISKPYLSSLRSGTHTLTFDFSGGRDPTLELLIIDSTPAPSTVTPQTALLDKAAASDLQFTLVTNGIPLTGISNGVTSLVYGNDYTITDTNRFTLLSRYLLSLDAGTNNIVFHLEKGEAPTASLKITDSREPAASVEPDSIAYDLRNGQPITVTAASNGYSFIGVKNKGIYLPAGSDYTRNGSELKISADFLLTLTPGEHSLEFVYDRGNAAELKLYITDTRSDPQLSLSSASFEKKPSHQGDIRLRMMANGHNLLSVKNGPYTLIPNKDFRTSGDELTILREYLLQQQTGMLRLLFDFTGDVDPILNITVTDSSLSKEGPNLLNNAGLDSWTSGRPQAWEVTASGDGRALLSNKTGFRLRSNAAELSAPAAGDRVALIQQGMQVAAGGLYRASFTYRTAFVAGDAKLLLSFKDENGATIHTASADLFKEEHDRFATKAEVDVTAPVGAVTASVEIYIEHGQVWIDEAKLQEIPNLVVNGSFERDLTGSGWAIRSEPGTTGGSVLREEAGGFDLDGVLVIRTSGSNDVWIAEQSPIPVLPEYRRYKVSALYKAEAMSSEAKAFVRLTWLDAHGAPIHVSDHSPLAAGQLDFNGFEAEILEKNGEWRKLTQVLLRPEGADRLKIELVGRGGVSKVAWDGIQVEPWADLFKADGTPATGISIAYDWSNDLKPEAFWTKIPEASLSTPKGSVWTSEMLRRHFFGLDGYYYLNYYSPINNLISTSKIPSLEKTIGVPAIPGWPSIVKAGDLPYNATVQPTGPNNEYYAVGNQSAVGMNATFYKLTGNPKFLDRAHELMEFSHYSQYKPDGDNAFARIHYPIEWQRLVETGRNLQYRGGWDYKFNYNWTNVYGYTYPKHAPDGHVNAQLGARMLNYYDITKDAEVLNAVFDFAYHQIPRNGFNYGIYKDRVYYWFGYGASTSGIPNDASNPLGDGTDNINAAKAHVFAKLGLLKNDKKMLELARGLLWYLVREYEYDGAFYYDSAENPLNTTRAVLDQSHETMMVWDAMHAFAYLKEAGVDISREEEVWGKALDMTINSTLWYQGDRYIKVLKAFDGIPAPNSELDIVSYMQVRGEGPYSRVKWFDKLGTHMVRPDTVKARMSVLLPPVAGKPDWTVDPARDLVIEVPLNRLENNGVTLPWKLKKGETVRIGYKAMANEQFDRSRDKMPNSGAAFYRIEDGVNQLEVAEGMAPPLHIDLNVNASNLLRYPATLYFPFPSAVTADVVLPPEPAAQGYIPQEWRKDAVNDRTVIHFKNAAPTDVDSTFDGSIYGQVSFNRFIEYDFFLPRSAMGSYKVVLERLNGSVDNQASIDGALLGSEKLISTELRSSLADLGEIVLSPGWHKIRFETPGSMSIMNVRFIAQTTSVPDQTAPVSTLRAAPETPDGTDGWYVSPVTIEIEAFDDATGVASKEYSLDGGKTWRLADAPFTFDADGRFVLLYRSTDNFGNTENARSIELKLDKTAPDLEIDLVDGAVFATSSELLLQAKVRDQASGAADSAPFVLLDGQPVQLGTPIRLHTLSLGTHTIEVSATDRAGNSRLLNRTFRTEASLASLETLVRRFYEEGSIGNKGIANSLLQKLEKGNVASFIHEVEARNGKQITREAASILLRDARSL